MLGSFQPNGVLPGAFFNWMRKRTVRAAPVTRSASRGTRFKLPDDFLWSFTFTFFYRCLDSLLKASLDKLTWLRSHRSVVERSDSFQNLLQASDLFYRLCSFLLFFLTWRANNIHDTTATNAFLRWLIWVPGCHVLAIRRPQTRRSGLTKPTFFWTS
jgi:hypothetical protein